MDVVSMVLQGVQVYQDVVQITYHAYVENGKNNQGGNSSIDYSALLEGQSNERGLVLRQLATWLLQVQ